MKKPIILLSILSVSVILAVILFTSLNKNNNFIEGAELKPSDWFYLQRSFPFDEINREAYKLGATQAVKFRNEQISSQKSNEVWELAGPTNIGGRISAVAMHSEDINTIYIGAAAGGVFKSPDGGNSWEAIFDDALSLSIGDIRIAESDPQIIYVGTGEANAGGGSLAYDGMGIYKSTDGGDSWIHLGLEEIGSVGRLAVHPKNPDIVYVAAMGRLFGNNSERGVYKTIDGGLNWEQILYLNDSTGAIDIVINPENPDTVYTALWQRVRKPAYRDYGGPACGIYRTYNGGQDWQELTNGIPVSNEGRIGIDISKSNPNILYSIYADRTGYFSGLYKTEDNGDTWTRTNDGSLSNIYSSYGWWFGRLHIDPNNPDVVFPIGFDLYKTSSGGDNYQFSSSGVHVDQHDLYVHPMNSQFCVLGSDGGLYISQNGGNSWQHINNLPITQFYTCEIDNQEPNRLYGGTQDNGTNRTMTGDLDDWEHIYGGDGFRVRVDPIDNNYVYAESQYGGFGRSTNGGSSFSSALSGINSSDPKNWNCPYIFNPLNPQIMYFGTNKLYKSTNRAQSWTAISPDLTSGGGNGNLTYGTITCMDVSSVNTDIIYVGTDDGHVWISQNDGDDWLDISENLPLRWVSSIACDPFQELTAYVCLSGYRYNTYMPHILKTTDGGLSWTDLQGNLPEIPINVIIPDPAVESAYYLATDFGLYYTTDGGAIWNIMGEGLPNSPIVDMDFHPETRNLIAATYGRSLYRISVDAFVGLNEINSQAQVEINVYPNPFTDQLNISLNVKEAGKIIVELFNIEGKIIQTIFKGQLESGNQIISTKSGSFNSSSFAAGTYFIKIQMGSSKITKTVVLNK